MMTLILKKNSAMTEFDKKDMNIANAIYSGDLDALKRFEQDTFSCRINVTQFLGLQNRKKIYNMRPLALIVLGEAKHPGKFLKYQKMIKFILQKNGYSQLFDSLEFYSYDIFGTKKIEDLRETLPFSENMMRYLIFLDEHYNNYGHKKIVDLLNGINEAKKTATFKEKQEIQKAKRLLVGIYRRSNPKRKLSPFFKLNAFMKEASRQISG